MPGRRAGICVAPFPLGGRSETARRHPDWIAGGSEQTARRGLPARALLVSDPDCLIVHPAVGRRDTLAAHVERFGGPRGLVRPSR